MIVYENTLNGFIDHCNDQKISSIINECILKVGISACSQSEIASWEKSLPFMADALDTEDINKDINVAVEYKLDLTRNRIDFLVYGQDDNNTSNLVIIELKQWSHVKKSNKPNYVYTYGGGGAKDYFHPSYQSYRYGSILSGFNEFIHNNDVNIETCSYLHNMDIIYDFNIKDNIEYPFIDQSPVFFKGDENKLNEFVRKHVSKSYRILLYQIDDSRIMPSLNFSKMMCDALEGQPIFTLDDQQANSVATIVFETKDALEHNKRKTIIIKGGPGTGKSVVAINAIGQLLYPRDRESRKNICYCTTNFTPRTLFSELLIDNDYRKSAIKELFKPLATFSRASEFDYDCVMYDEAHRAYTWKFGQGVKKSVDMIDKAFYASRVNVFFIDEDQSVTKDDFLTIEKIKKYAKKYNSEIIEGQELELTSQFRCIGGQSYIEFINTLLGYSKNVSKYIIKNYDFKVFNSPTELWNAIRSKQNEYLDARLLAGYTHDWISQHDDNAYDFNMENGNFKMKWNKKINIAYINDPNQLDRIGCIHTIQGVDMSYAGIIIGKDLAYRNGQLVFIQSENAVTDKASGIRNANHADAVKMIRNTYKVLLTRAIYGTYIFCEDQELSNYIKTYIEEN